MKGDLLFKEDFLSPKNDYFAQMGCDPIGFVLLFVFDGTQGMTPGRRQFRK